MTIEDFVKEFGFELLKNGDDYSTAAILNDSINLVWVTEDPEVSDYPFLVIGPYSYTIEEDSAFIRLLGTVGTMSADLQVNDAPDLPPVFAFFAANPWVVQHLEWRIYFDSSCVRASAQVWNDEITVEYAADGSYGCFLNGEQADTLDILHAIQRRLKSFHAHAVEREETCS